MATACTLQENSESTIVDAFSTQKSTNNKLLYYILANSNSNFKKSEHRYVFEHHYGPVAKHHHVHHKDHNPKNNNPSNLESMHKDAHAQYHGNMIRGLANPHLQDQI
jgi:hypothetical protein